MSEIKRVKIGSIIESQIPEFLSVESPLFVDFLKQYYQSLEHQSGAIDILTNITKYKNFKKFNKVDLTEQTTLSSDILTFDTSIRVASTSGWPDSYGLLKINDEIITYTSKTSTSFEGCIRGFSGIDNLESLSDPENLEFSTTNADEHSSGDVVKNLSNIFLINFFERFKFEFLPGFENRDFFENISIENVAYKIKDLYASKGTDQSYKLLFKILYGVDIDIIKPQEYTLSPSSNSYFITKNVLVEKISGGDPTLTKGNFLFQSLSGIGTVSASIFNVEYRPVDRKDFYEISLDSTSFTGTFQVSGKTKLLEDVTPGSDNILVDSTIGFSNSGNILVKPQNSDYITLSYTGKTINQFTGVSGITTSLFFGQDLTEEKFAFSYIGIGNTSKIDFRVVNVIDDIDFSKTSNLRVGDNISLSGFGRDLYDQYEFNSWIYNIPTTHDIFNIDQIDSTKFRVTLYDKVYFYQGETISLLDIFDNKIEVDIISVEYDTGDIVKKYSNRILIQVVGAGSFSVSDANRIKKIIYKGNHQQNNFEGLGSIPTSVQNTYINSDDKFFYVTSSGLPNYTLFSTENKKSLSTVGSGITDTFSVPNHNFQSGELVYIAPTVQAGISTGIYHVTRIDNNTLRLSFSKSDIFSRKYVKATSEIVNEDLYKSGYQGKTIRNQKLLKKFPIDKTRSVFDDLNERTTFNREIGLLANGVELFAPTLFDENIYYGEVQSIKVTNSGEDYDVIDVPPLTIIDETGSGCKAHVNLSGTIKEVKILNAGYGYQEKPKITITGGNGRGALLETNFVKSKVSAGFKADTSISIALNTIQFLNDVPFEDGEEVIYDSNKNNNLPGIIDGSRYFVGKISDDTIKLFNTKTDALKKTNELDIVGITSGFHFITTLKNKNTFTTVYVKNPGEGYSNRKVRVPSVLSADNRTLGINTFDSYIFAKNHGFKSSELVSYSSSDTVISGMSTSVYYYVKVIDVNKFRLYEAGIGTTLNDENYVKNKFVKFDSLGIGTHTIGYPPIELKVEAKSALASTSIITPILKPIITGSIEDVYVENGGTGYGCTDILNFHRRPNAGIASITSQAILRPIIIGGSIVDVQIINKGRGFRENSEIIISGTGNYAQIEPIVVDGRLSNINIVSGGVGYASSNTTLTLVNRGKNAKFITDIKEWKINQIIKSKNIISPEDDGIISVSKNPDFELQFINFFIPKKLRYQLSDNFTEDNKESSGTLTHSPILGFAYDGSPIYGPYGYDTPTGGLVRKMQSSYILDVNTDPGVRPPAKEGGFFIDDYRYDGSGDLDRQNGRYGVTPEYPDGVYAYFYSIDITPSNESVPRYPYIVGPYFYNRPIVENFLPLYSQDVDVFNTSLSRNIGPYYINRANSSYGLIDRVSEEFKQEFYVDSIQTGKIENVSIFSPGDNYKVDDLVDIDVTGTDGIQPNIVVSEVSGRQVDGFTLVQDSLDDAEFFIKTKNTTVTTSSPHGIKDGQPINVIGISTITSAGLEGIKRASVQEKTVQLAEDIDTAIVTGVSTFIKVRDINVFRVDDYIGIGTEVLLITGIDPKRSGFDVLRLENTGIHTVGIDNVKLLPRRFDIPTGNVTDSTFENYVTYFNPQIDVGIGDTGSVRTTVGLGSTSFVNRFIPSRSIYIPGHKFFTGQELRYNSGSRFIGTSLYVNNVGSAQSIKIEDNQIVYAVNLGKDYLGISTVGFTTSTGIGTNLTAVEFWDQEDSYGVIGYAHSFTTVYPRTTASIEKTLGIVTTTTNHNLEVDDIIEFKLETNYNEVIKVVFDPVNRKVLAKDISFTDSEVSVVNNSIDVSSYTGNVNTGDKLVYISSTPIGGLENYGIYYVSKTDPNSIKLCRYRSDIIESNFIEFSSAGGSTQDLYFINPELTSINTINLEFDLSDSSLLDLDIKFYFDWKFSEEINEREGFFVSRSGTPGTAGAKVVLDLIKQKDPVYYNLVPRSTGDEAKNQISTDVDVKSFNKVSLVTHPLNNKFEVISTSTDTTFTFYNNRILNYVQNQVLNQATGFSYKTTSESALGPISKLKINFPGRGYTKLPKIRGVKSTLGTNAVLKLISPNVGRVETFSRIKDGFDYPTDPTLSPSLSVPAIIGIKDILTIESVGIITGGVRYNSAPKLIVKNDTSGIDLNAIVASGSIVRVDILKNSTSLSSPLEIVPIYNSNGYEIDFITTSGDLVTLELSNNPSFNPFIPIGFGSTEYIFPFAVGDEIFIENCRLTSDTNTLQNFNSADYNYSFFKVTDIDVNNNTVTYDMTGISTGGFGTYNDELNLGVVINRNDMPRFQMNLKDDVKYASDEKVSSETFSGVVMKNGWDNELNQMRLKNIFGEINVGDKIFGETSKVNGTVEYFDTFNLFSTLGSSRNKKSNIDLSSGILNDYLQRISDNFYYQKFAYSIKGEVPYSTWKESVRSIVHPSGFKEFSDYELVTKASTNMKPGLLTSDTFTFINIDQVIPLSLRTNFARVFEEETLPDGSIQNIFFDEGVDLAPYLLNKTNKVLEIDDISDQFNGTTTQSLNSRNVGASDLLDVNKEFIKKEVVGFITNTYPGILANPDWNPTIWEGYTETVITAISRDVKYNANNESVIAGLSFWSGIGTNFVAGEETETIGGFEYIIDLSKYVINNVAISTSYQNPEFTEPQQFDTRVPPDTDCDPNYNENCYADVQSAITDSVGIITTIVGLGTTALPEEVVYPLTSRASEIVGLSSFKLTNKGVPLFRREFTGSSIDVVNDKFIIQNHNFQSGQELVYSNIGGTRVGIATTSYVTGEKDTLVTVQNFDGTAIFENGYSVGITTTISGISTILSPAGPSFKQYTQVIGDGTSGTDAVFNVLITYDVGTGEPLSTSITLIKGGRGYSVGETVSIAGTYMGGVDPVNDLSFVVSKTGPTVIQSEANQSYSEVPSTDELSLFNVSRDNDGNIDTITVLNGGSGYDSNSVVSIAGTYLGGTTPEDTISFTPNELGTINLPISVFVFKLNDNEFKLSGLSTSVFLDITNVGTGTHVLAYKDPNPSVIITIDGIVQKAVARKSLSVSLGSSVGTASTTILTISSGISSLNVRDIINIDDELISIKGIGITSTDQITVERGYFGTVAVSHTVGASATVLNGDFNVVGDVIYFDDAPYGKIGPVGLQTASIFGGRVFSRQFDTSQPTDKNVLFDDISLSFTGIAATEFTLKVNDLTTDVAFNNVNSGTDINNNPIILINNIFQDPTFDYTVDGSGVNVLRFLSGTPSAGKISKVSVSTSFGYVPRLGAAASAVVDVNGTISNIIVLGGGAGFRDAPVVSIASTIGTGASVTATVGASGTITGFTIVNAGTGYTDTSLPTVVIGFPTAYSNLSLGYTGGSSGVGQDAQITVEVGQGSSIISYKFDNPGIAYKVGDILTPIGIPTTSPFYQFELTVDEVQTDSFSGFYPGQFIRFNDISPFFNGFRKKFTVSTTVNGERQVLGLRVPDGTDLDITNNIFIYLNDVLQVPNVAYTFNGTRVNFTEAPKAGSKCVILYYRGSSVDVELVDPPKTIKPGDTVQILDNPNDPFDITQFPRTAKKIIASDQLETFNYYSIGINTDPEKLRPLSWSKQTQDTVISGTLYSKARPDLKSRIKPIATVIKPVTKSDTEIYVDNVFPIFSDVDNLSEDLRNVIVFDNQEISPALVSVAVSSTSSVSSINIIDGGVGYANTLSPEVSISESYIVTKDPIFNWTGGTGINTTYSLKSIKFNDRFVSVGDNSVLALSYNGIDWSIGNVGVGTTISYKSVESVGVGTSNFVFAVGTGGRIIKATDYNDSISSWEDIPLEQDLIVPGFGSIGRIGAGYTDTLLDIVYSSLTDTIVAVGAGGSIFTGVGVATDSFTSKFSETLSDLNSITFGTDYFVLVGDNGVIRSSNTGIIWEFVNSPVVTNLNKVIYAEGKYVAVGDFGVIVQEVTRDSYQSISNNLGIVNLINIAYHYGLYTALSSTGDLYYSFNLSNWILRSTNQSNFLNDLVFVDNLGGDGRYVAIGSGATSIYAEPILNRATATSSVTAGVVTSITIDNPGFGYDENNPPPAIIASDSFNLEEIKSIKALGDHGIIIGIQTFLAGTPGIGTTSPKISFTLKSEEYDNTTLGVGYSSLNNYGVLNSQLSKGDYFVISDSNVETGGDLVGITTLLGGMSNFPNSKIGTAKSFIDGVYIVEDVTTPNLGIVTVTCNFAPMESNYVKVYARGSDQSGIGTNVFYGRYSWGKIYDYQNRVLSDPKDFAVYNDNGLVGISSSPKVSRTRSIISD